MNIFEPITTLFDFIKSFFLRITSEQDIDNSDNPWQGLSSYPDPINSTHKKQFCGRDSETYDVTQLIKNHLFVTLYGKSGNGKTSLLNAGVCPKLRKERYFPISIRLGILDQDVCLQKHIITAIESQNILHQEEIDVIDKVEDNTAIDYLWNYFARHRFYNDDNKLVFPVIIFDQFEEVFRDRYADAATLLKQIYFMMDEGHVLPEKDIDGKLYRYSFNFRFVVSIREDDLYRLEDAIDNNFLSLMKQNRYRLRPITKEGARDIILNPGKGLFAENDEEKIVETIVDASTDKENVVGANVLSLLCSNIYIQKQKDKQQTEKQRGKNTTEDKNALITHEYVEKLISDDPMEYFYYKATRNLTSKGKAYLRDNLVDISGRRANIPRANFDKNVRNGATLFSGSNKILQESNGRVELVHDSFCPVIEKQQIEKRDNFYSWILSFVMMLSLFFQPINLFSCSFNYVEIAKTIAVFTITIGILRKSPNILWSIVGLTFSIIPICLYFYKFTELTITHCCYIIINILIAIYSLVSLIYSFKVDKKIQYEISYWEFRKIGEKYSNLITTVPFLLIICGVICSGLLLNYFEDIFFQIVKAIFFVASSYLTVTVWTLYLIQKTKQMIISLFFYTIIPLSIISSCVCDTSMFVFGGIDNLLIVGIIYSFIIISDLMSSNYKETLIKKASYCVFFIMYIFLYQYKFFFFIIWAVLSSIFVLYNYGVKSARLKYKIMTTVFCCFLVLLLLLFDFGYAAWNTNGIDINKQCVNWKLITILRESNNKYEVIDHKDQMIPIRFDDMIQDTLSTKTKYRFTSNSNKILNQKDSIACYNYSPIIELHCSDTIIQSYRDTLLYNLKEGKDLSDDNYPITLDSLDIDEKKYRFRKLVTIAHNNTSATQNKLLKVLYKGLSASLLQSASIDISPDTPERMKQLMDAFNAYVLGRIDNDVHKYDAVTFVDLLIDLFSDQSDNMDYDALFEHTAQLYLNMKDGKLRDDFIPSVLPDLVELYNEQATDYKFKLRLYAKIVRLNQIAEKFELQSYPIKSPFELDL